MCCIFNQNEKKNIAHNIAMDLFMHGASQITQLTIQMFHCTGQINQSDSANIDKWKEVFAGKILQQSQVEYQQPIGEGKQHY